MILSPLSFPDPTWGRWSWGSLHALLQAPLTPTPSLHVPHLMGARRQKGTVHTNQHCMQSSRTHQMALHAKQPCTQNDCSSTSRSSAVSLLALPPRCHQPPLPITASLPSGLFTVACGSHQGAPAGHCASRGRADTMFFSSILNEFGFFRALFAELFLGRAWALTWVVFPQ